MSKFIKIILIIVGALVALFLAAVLALVMLVDPNEYKDEIAKKVQEQTGRELVFEGDIGFNFFPWLGLNVGPMALGNAQGFSPNEMVRINHAEASIRIMPLFTGEVKIGMVVLDGFTLNLAKNKQGVTNWDDLSKSEGTNTSKEETTTEKQDSGESGSKIDALSVEGVEITNANVVYDDQQTGKKTSITNLNLIIGEVGNKIRFPFELSFDLKLDDPKIDTRPVLTGYATFDQDASTIKIDEMKFTAMGLNVLGDFFAESGTAGLNYSGAIELKETSIKALLGELGMDPIITTDPTALTKLSMNMKFNGTDSAVQLESLLVNLDDTKITVEGSVKNFAKPAIRVTANVDDIDADRYMPPATESTEKSQTKTTTATTSSEPAQEPDLSALKGQDVVAKLTMGKVKAMNLTVTDILLDLVIKNGVATLKPFSAKLYDGELKGSSVLNANPKIATWTEQAELTGVQAGPLLQDLIGDPKLLGTGVVKYDLNGYGLTPDNIKKSITGTASFAFTDGAINGINIAQMLRNGWNSLKGKTIATSETEKTDFAELLGSATINKGSVVNKDLLMKSPLLRVNGEGWANLPKNTTDYTATVTVVGTLKGQDGASLEDLKGVPLPIRVKGNLNDPSISLDMKALGEALFKGKLGKGTKDLENDLKEKLLGGSKSKDGKKITNPLKGLF